MVAPFQRNWVTFPELGGKGGSYHTGYPWESLLLFLGKIGHQNGISPDKELFVYPKDGALVHLGR